ncbi:MAG: hypothetical protein ACREJX_16425 [Polyangiaceae bacterium]
MKKTRRLPLARALAFACIFHATACQVQCAHSEEPKNTVSLHLTGTGTPGATVIVDDQLIGPLGSVRARGVALPPGRHTVTIENAGYFPFDRIVEAPDNASAKPISIDVTLVKVPD